MMRIVNGERLGTGTWNRPGVGMLGWLTLSAALLGCARGDDRLGVKQSALTRTPWQINLGEGLVAFPTPAPSHGAVAEYDVATIPEATDLGWGPAPDENVIGFDDTPSSLCGVAACFSAGQFTYFQTFVEVPDNVVVTTFTIAFSGIDDGTRTTIFNSDHPGGAVVPGSFVFLGGTGTADLAALVKSGDVNRVVVTHVDDCCVGSTLRSAVVVLNGQTVTTGCTSDAECDDGDACTQDACNPDGSCSHAEVSCDDGNGCTLDRCDPASGCSHVDQCPDCSAAAATMATLWPPNHKLVDVGVQGVTDPQGQPVTIRIDSIRQDEPTNTFGDGDTCPDAEGVGTDTAALRAERSGTNKVPGDGRVYHLGFTATDPDGFRCTGEVTSCVPHDQGQGATCVDEGPLYDSLSCPLP
jgi:hypothetical protein